MFCLIEGTRGTLPDRDNRNFASEIFRSCGLLARTMSELLEAV